MRAPADQEKRSPGRPRSERAGIAILNAVIDLLLEGTPLAALSVEAVAARAGVGKATIYRRWAGKDDLVAAAARSLKPIPTRPRGRSAREDLLELLPNIGMCSRGPGYAVMAALLPDLRRNEDLYQLYQTAIEPSRDVMRDVLRRGMERGELRADLDIEITVAMLTAPMVLQKLFRANPRLDRDGVAERLVNAVLDGARAR